MHGYTLWSRKGAPKPDLSRVTLLSIASVDPIPGGVLLCDGTWVLRAALALGRRAGERNEAKREAMQTIAGELGLEVTEREASKTWCEMMDLL